MDFRCRRSGSGVRVLHFFAAGFFARLSLSVQNGAAPVFGLQRFERGEIPVDTLVQPIFAATDCRQSVRLPLEGYRLGECRVGFGPIGFYCITGILCAHGKERHRGRAEMVETPDIPGDGVGEMQLHGSLWREVGDQLLFELLKSRTIFFGEDDHLTGNRIPPRVQTGLVLPLCIAGLPGLRWLTPICFCALINPCSPG